MSRAATADSYVRRLQRVTAHIHAHLDEPMDLEQLAAIACLSPFHFHRTYRSMIGETVIETVTRLRLHRAANALAQTPTAIARIAAQAGYASVQAFSRAFRAAYGKSPAVFRADRRHTPGPITMTVNIQDRPTLRIACIKHIGPPQQIGRAFDRVMAWAGPMGVAMPPALGVAVYLSDMKTVPPEEQEALAGLTVGPQIMADEIVEIYEAPAGRYAVLLYKGPYALIGKGYEQLFAWLPSSGEEPAHRPMMEINLNDPRQTAPEDLLTELCLPLR